MNLLFWNVDRLSGKTSATRERSARVFSVIETFAVDIIGISEVNSSALKYLRAFARANGYICGHRPPDENPRHTVLLARNNFDVKARRVYWRPSPHEAAPASEIVIAALYGV